MSETRIALAGFPFDENSTYLRGPAQAPAIIREALHCGSANLTAENGVDLDNHPGFSDQGDYPIKTSAQAMVEIEASARALLSQKYALLSLGGDHSITYPLVKAHAALHGPLTILHLDAHPDLYSAYEGNQYSHACPFARIMEEGLAKRLVQVGIRTMNAHQKEQADRFSVEVIDMQHWDPNGLPTLDEPLYISLDIDVLDPGFAPGVSHHEPGGLSPREVINLINGIQVPLIGADIVEFNPSRDPSGITAMVAAKLVKELAGKMFLR